MSLEALLSRMNELARTSKLELSVANSMAAVTANRIFSEGRSSNDSEIGKYSLGYLKQRQKAGYPSSRKVILQLTRQMVNDWSIVIDKGGVGLGFKNQTNADKSGWVEETYNKPIFNHTSKELKLVSGLFNDGVKKTIDG